MSISIASDRNMESGSAYMVKMISASRPVSRPLSGPQGLLTTTRLTLITRSPTSIPTGDQPFIRDMATPIGMVGSVNGFGPAPSRASGSGSCSIPGLSSEERTEEQSICIRETDIIADHLAYDLSIPDSAKFSIAIRNARITNKTEERKLHEDLDRLQKHLDTATKQIATEEINLMDDLELRSKTMFDMKNMSTRNLGVYPVRMTPRALGGATTAPAAAETGHSESQMARARARDDHYFYLPPLRKQLHVGLVLAKQPARSKTARQNMQSRVRTERKRLTLAGTRYFNGDETQDKTSKNSTEEGKPEEENDKENKFPDIEPPSPSPKSVRGDTTSRTPRMAPLHVTHFVDTDFGFSQDRIRESTGMSQQKLLVNENDLEKEIQNVAKKHIYAMQTPSMSYRGSKATEGVRNLRDTLYPMNRSNTSLVLMSTKGKTKTEDFSYARDRKDNKIAIGRIANGMNTHRPLEAFSIIGKSSV